MKFNKLLFLFLIINNSMCSFSQQPQVVVTTGHSKPITKFAIAPKGNLLASNSINHIIKIWDIASGKEICALNNQGDEEDNEERINSVDFFDDGKRLMSTDENGKINVWDIEAEKPIHTFKGVNGLPGLSANIHKNKIIFINKEYALSVADLDNLPANNYTDIKPRIIKINPADPNQVFIVDLKNEFYIYDIAKRTKILEFEEENNYVFNVEISANGKFIAIVFSDMQMKVWSIKTGKLVKWFKDIKPMDIEFNKSTNELVVLYQDTKDFKNKLYIYDSKTFEKKRVIEGISLFASSINISKNGEFIVTNSMTLKEKAYSYTLSIFRYKNGKLINNLKSRAHGIWQLVAAKNTPRVAALGLDLNLRIWNISNQQIEKVIPYVQKIALNKGGNIIAMHGYHFLSYKQSIILWDIDSLKYITHIPYIDLISDMQICADDKHIVVSKVAGDIDIIDIEKKAVIKTIKGSSMGNQSVDISPDMNYIAATASGLAGIKVYDLKNEKEVQIEGAHKLLGASEVRFSSDGKYLLSGSFDQDVNVWETGTWKKLQDLEGTKGPIYSVALNFDNKLAASASMGSTVVKSDYAVNVWDVESGVLKCNLKGHFLNVMSVAFNEKNRLLFSGGDDGMLKVWSLDSCKEIVSCISIDYDDYIFVTPDYHYSGSRDALKGVGFKMSGLKLYPFEQFDLRLNRPDIIAERIGLAPPELIKAFKNAYKKRLEKMGYNESMFNKDFSLPQLSIKNKTKIAFNTKNKNMSLDVYAKDDKYKLDRINVWINNVPIFGRKGISLKSKNVNEVSENVKFNLSEGMNKIQISVLNEKGVESLKETVNITNESSSVKHNLYIVAVGVSDYINDDYDLNYAAKDAMDLCNIFEKSGKMFDNVFVTPVLDHNATKDNILKTKEILKKTTIDDMVILFTAGHGFLDDNLDYFFATTDVDIEKPSEKGLAYDEIENIIDDIPARKKIILMDACHSGEVDYDEYDLHVESMYENVVARSVYVSRSSLSKIGLDNSFRLMKELFTDLRRGSGAIVISSAGGVEFAFESDKLKNGVFTYVLMKGLTSQKADLNGDGSITISELKDFVIRRVSELTKGRQNPTARRENLEFDFKVW